MSDGPERRIADALRRRGLDLPARLLLDAHRPLAPLLADAAVALGAVLPAALPPRAAGDVARILDDGDQDPLTRLLTALDERDDRDAVAG